MHLLVKILNRIYPPVHFPTCSSSSCVSFGGQNGSMRRSYFSEPRHRSALFPSLIVACHNNAGNVAVAENDLAMELLADFLEKNMEACQADGHASSAALSAAEEVSWSGLIFFLPCLYFVLSIFFWSRRRSVGFLVGWCSRFEYFLYSNFCGLGSSSIGSVSPAPFT